MSVRHFTVPLVALGLTTTLSTGCGANGIVGSWLLTDIEVDGESYNYLLDGYSYTYGSCTYTASTAFTLEFDKDDRDGDTFEGEFVQTYTYSYVGDCDEQSYSDSYSYDAEAKRGDDKSYEIEVDELDWDLECTIEDDELLCEGDTDGSDVELTWERE